MGVACGVWRVACGTCGREDKCIQISGKYM